MGSVPNILVVIAGSAIPQVSGPYGSFEALFYDGLTHLGGECTTTPYELNGWTPNQRPPTLEHYDGVIVTGSAAMVGEELPWMQYGEELLRRIVKKDMPLFAVCFGHQLLAKAFGSDVGPNPQGYGIGSGSINLRSHIPLPNVPSGTIPVNISHFDVVKTAGPRLEILGSAEHDPNHFYTIGGRAFGLQFHPEFTGNVIKAYIGARKEAIHEHHGLGAVDKRLHAAQNTPDSMGLLSSFLELCHS